MLDHKLRLRPMPGTLAICKLEAASPIPDWVVTAGFFSVTRTQDELSFVAPQESVPESVQCERGWRALKIEGTLDFSLVGILVSVCAPLAEAGISVFAISTFDTDYVLVKQTQFEYALNVLGRHHIVSL